MHYLAIGLNYEKTPVVLRERLAFQESHLGKALHQLTGRSNSEDSQVAEGVILSTCNRVEIYAVVKNLEGGAAAIKRFIGSYHGIPVAEFEEYLYQYEDFDVAEYLFSVTSGLKSMVLGEPQIQGQVKKAYETALKFKTTGPLLCNLFQSALSVGKRSRTETTISEHSLSISHAAVNRLKTQVDDLSSLNVLILGVGKMSCLAIKALLKDGVRNIIVMNRTEENARSLAEEFGVKTRGFEHLAAELGTADVVISSTGAPHAVLSYDTVMAAQTARQRPLFIFDIAVPRDVDPAVETIGGVELLNIDQLQGAVEQNRELRCQEVNDVRAIINNEMMKFLEWFQTLEIKPVIKALRQEMELIREQELERALRKLGDEVSSADSQVVAELSRRLINKILHQPIMKLRQEAIEGNGQHYTTALRSLFNLESKNIP